MKDLDSRNSNKRNSVSQIMTHASHPIMLRILFLLSATDISLVSPTQIFPFPNNGRSGNNHHQQAERIPKEFESIPITKPQTKHR